MVSGYVPSRRNSSRPPSNLGLVDKSLKLDVNTSSKLDFTQNKSFESSDDQHPTQKPKNVQDHDDVNGSIVSQEDPLTPKHQKPKWYSAPAKTYLKTKLN